MEDRIPNGTRKLTLDEHELNHKLGLCILRNSKSLNIDIKELKLSLHELPIPKKEDISERAIGFARKYHEYIEKWQYGKGEVDKETFANECDDYKKMVQHEYELVKIRLDDLEDTKVILLLGERGFNANQIKLKLWKACESLEDEMCTFDLSLERLNMIEKLLMGSEHKLTDSLFLYTDATSYVCR